MILEHKDMLIYFPPVYDTAFDTIRKKEDQVVKNLFFSDMTKRIFIIVAGRTLKQVSWNICTLILDNGFKCIAKDFGSDYWIWER